MSRPDPVHSPLFRASTMHRIHWSTVVTLTLGVILTLAVVLQLLPATATVDAVPARAVAQSASFVEAGALPLPLFIVGAMLAVLLTAAALWSAAARPDQVGLLSAEPTR